MNKVNLSPFLTIKDNSQKEVTPTPRLLSKNKKTNSHINKLRVIKKQSVDNEEIFHFDDTACFREFNKFAANTEGIHQDQSRAKKCCSQILAVKMMEDNRPSPFSEYPPAKTFQRQGDLHHMDTLVLLSQENRQEAADAIRNYTSQSSRRKYFRRHQAQRNMLPSHLFVSREHSSLAESTMLPQSSPFRSEPARQRPKSKGKGWNLSPGQALRTDKSLGQYAKKSNFLQYSIIKPEQIKSLALLARRHEKESQQKKRRDQKAFYLQMMQQIKKKQEILKRNAKLKEELENSSQRARQVAKRPILYSSATHRNNYNTFEEKNELRPWEVDTFAHDIL